MRITITEALAEIKTIGKRVAAKRELIKAHLVRQRKMVDPFASGGGSAAKLAAENQSILDLERRLVSLRRAIFRANDETVVTLESRGLSVSRTINEWLIWRREIVPSASKHLNDLRAYYATVRREAASKSIQMTAISGAETGDDVIINYPESAMIEDAEILADLLGALDGQLSLKNATVFIDIPD